MNFKWHVSTVENLAYRYTFNVSYTCILQRLQNKIDEENRANAEIESYLRAHTSVSGTTSLHNVKVQSFPLVWIIIMDICKAAQSAGQT